jgi:hypothetical protein
MRLPTGHDRYEASIHIKRSFAADECLAKFVLPKRRIPGASRACSDAGPEAPQLGRLHEACNVSPVRSAECWPAISSVRAQKIFVWGAYFLLSVLSFVRDFYE